MTEINRNWVTLPAEILQQVFRLIPEQELTEVALVCKAWVRPAQTLLFSTVCIRKFFGLEEFYDIIKCNNQLGNHVRVLYLEDSFVQLSILGRKGAFETLTLLLSNHLPYVEVLPVEAFESYVPVLNALKDFKLKRLKRISPPTYKHVESEMHNYITSVLLMKERIENLLISDNYGALKLYVSDQAMFDRLYNKLEQFDKLKEIGIQRITDNSIQLIEHIVETCKSLTKISFIFKLRNSPNVQQNKDISMEDISNFISRSNIKSVCHSTDSFLDEKTLIYVMHKFPCLDKLALQFSNQPFTPYQPSRQTLTQLLHYLSNIEDFSASNIYVHHDITTEIIGRFWETTCAPANKDVRFVYSDNISHDSLSLFTDHTSITYPSEDTQWEHVGFIERNGKYLKRMQIFCVYYGDDDLGLALPSALMAHIFTHCPNLKYLHLLQGSFRRALNIGFDRKVSLDEFIMEECDIWSETQKEWSFMISNIKRLEIGLMQYFSEGSKDLAGAGVNMPHTHIDEVAIKVSDFEFRYVKLYVESDECNYYYRLDSNKVNYSTPNSKSSYDTEVITKEEYNEKPVDERIYICCQNIPALVFEK